MSITTSFYGTLPAVKGPMFSNSAVNMSWTGIRFGVNRHDAPFGWTGIRTIQVPSRTGKRDGSGENGNERDQDK